MAGKNFEKQITKRWEKYRSQLVDVRDLLQNNQEISHLESEERISQIIDRKKALNPFLYTQQFLKKFDILKTHLTERKAKFSEEKVLSLVEESIQGVTDDIKSTEYFEKGIFAAKCVGKVFTGIESGTGFLIGESLMLTNHHVIESEDVALYSTFTLDYEDNLVGAAKAAQEFELDPTTFFITNRELDFTVVAVNPESNNTVSLQSYGFHPLISRQGKIKLGDPVNIIHHPEGDPKRVTFRNNQLIFIKNEDDAAQNPKSPGNFCLYLSDTLKGSSGAPVFNDRWEVVAVHHAGAPMKFMENRVEVLNEKERDTADLKANEGIRISKIVQAIENKSFDEDKRHMEKKRDELIHLWNRSRTPQTESMTMVKGSDRIHRIESNGLNITITITHK